MAYSDELPAQKDWYNGIEFRSKLESKTAQALDNIGIPYVYEPDGYKLSNGLWYRPDFWLPNVQQFIECKGVMSSTDSAKIVGLVEDTNCPVMVISYDNAMMVQRFWGSQDGEIATYTNCLALAQCEDCGALWFLSAADYYGCPHCGAYHNGKSTQLITDINSGQQLFNYGQEIAADKPLYQEIANSFNN